MTSKPAIKIRILDGGLGTTLETNHGYTFSLSTPLWSSHLLLTESDQETLLNCHKAFVDAGADIVSTATYQVSADGFAATKTEQWPNGIPPSSIPQFLATAIQLASQAATTNTTTTTSTKSASPRQHPHSHPHRHRQPTQISLSLGPLGATVLPSSAEYSGEYPAQYSSVSQIQQWHRDRLDLFFFSTTLQNQISPDDLLSKISYLAFETIPRLDEAIAIRRVLSTTSTSKNNNLLSKKIESKEQEEKKLLVWMSFVFPGEEDELPDGSSVEQVVNAALGPVPVPPLESQQQGEEEEGGQEEKKYPMTAVVPWGIGINCTKVGKLGRLVKQFEEAVGTLVRDGKVKEWPALVLYPDGTKGEVYNVETKRWEVPEGEKGESRAPWEVQVAEVVNEARRTGGWKEILVGGCCRCTPSDIGRLRRVIYGDSEGGTKQHLE